jgi:hypothetical protein
MMVNVIKCIQYQSVHWTDPDIMTLVVFGVIFTDSLLATEVFFRCKDNAAENFAGKGVVALILIRGGSSSGILPLVET